jgi:hypothetical protein
MLPYWRLFGAYRQEEAISQAGDIRRWTIVEIGHSDQGSRWSGLFVVVVILLKFIFIVEQDE